MTASKTLPPPVPATHPMVRQPPADVSCEKTGPAASDAADAKPTLLGDSCCQKPDDAAEVATACASKPFLGTSGMRPAGKTLVQGVGPAQPSDLRKSWASRTRPRPGPPLR